MHYMLIFALKYCEAIDMLIQDKKNNLCKCKLNKDEWETTFQLWDILKVSLHIYIIFKHWSSILHCHSASSFLFNVSTLNINIYDWTLTVSVAGVR